MPCCIHVAFHDPLLAEVLDGVKIYFDFMLRDHLLYEQEREQYDRLLGSLQLRAQEYQVQGQLKQDPPPTFTFTHKCCYVNSRTHLSEDNCGYFQQLQHLLLASTVSLSLYIYFSLSLSCIC